MLFVFGILIINVIWDLLVGELFVGMFWGVEVVLIVFVIGVGVVIVLLII